MSSGTPDSRREDDVLMTPRTGGSSEHSGGLRHSGLALNSDQAFEAGPLGLRTRCERS